jgi:hypothetical protein
MDEGVAVPADFLDRCQKLIGHALIGGDAMDESLSAYRAPGCAPSNFAPVKPQTGLELCEQADDICRLQVPETGPEVRRGHTRDPEDGPVARGVLAQSFHGQSRGAVLVQHGRQSIEESLLLH